MNNSLLNIDSSGSSQGAVSSETESAPSSGSSLGVEIGDISSFVTDGKILNKYNSVSEALKGTQHLSTKYREAMDAIPKAPDAYEFDFSGEEYGGLSLDSESSVVKSVLETMKQNNIPQEAANAILGAYLKNSAAQRDEYLKEMKEKTSPQDLKQLETFGSKLSPEDREVLMSISDSPEAVSFLARHLAPRAENIPGNFSSRASKMNAEDYMAKAMEIKNNPNFGLDAELNEEFSKYLKLYRENL